MSSLKDSIDIADAEKKTLLKLLKYYLPNTEVWAYGSRVSWTSSPTSDLDLVAFALPEQKAAVSKLREALEASSLPFRVDLFIWDEVPETFRGPIKETHVVLQESEKEEKSQNRGTEERMNWVNSTVGEFCPFAYGKSLPEKNREEGSIPVYGSNGIVGFHNSAYIADSGVIVGRKGSVGFIHFSEQDFWPIDTTFFVNKGTESENRFCYYLLSTLGLQSMNFDAAVPGLNRENAHALKIRIPDSEKSRKDLVEPLKIIDDKIALNRKLNETLEGMARALFQSWFVNFDPVKAKLVAVRNERDPEKACMAAISGKLRIHPGKPKLNTLDDQLPTVEELDVSIAALDTLSEAQRNQLAQTASAFPATFQESELGLIPKSWTITNIESIIQLAYGKALKKNERQNGDVPVYGSGGVNGYHNKRLVEGPGIIVGRKGTVGSIYWERKNFFPIDTVFYVKPKEGIPLIWTLYLLETLGLKDMNTDAAVPGLNRNNVYKIELPNFPFRLIQLFASETSLIRKEIDANETQSRTLAQMRDTLLPKLLSGELSVGKAQETLGALT